MDAMQLDSLVTRLTILTEELEHHLSETPALGATEEQQLVLSWLHHAHDNLLYAMSDMGEAVDLMQQEELTI
jgi:hypothetical protein